MQIEQIPLPKPLEELGVRELRRKRLVARVNTKVLSYLANELIRAGFEWLLPVVLSKSTDPLWPDPGASIEKRIEIEAYGEMVRITQSMIIHKLVACSLIHPKFFIFSPNIRIEKRDRSKTGRHTYEFTQLDFEVREASSAYIMELVEKLVCGLLRHLSTDANDELSELGIDLPEYKRPFKVYDRGELLSEYGENWDSHLISQLDSPVWVTNIPREFYDFEDFKKKRWDNYDLFVPEYGEILSGARREWEYNKIITKMDRDGVRKENYGLIIRLAKEGRLKPSAGAGIGIERLVGWITKAQHVGEVQTFPKVPGIVYEL